MSEEICLRYQVSSRIGNPEVEISVLGAAIRNEYPTKVDASFVKEFIGEFPGKTLVEVLQSARDHIKTRTCDTPTFKEGVPDIDYYIKRYPEGPVGIVYGAEGNWPLVEQSDEQRLQREVKIRDKNAKVHDRIFPALEEFVRINGFQPS